jgi:TolA-binding protein
MLLNLFHKIFNPKEPLSRKEIDTYLSKESDEVSRRAIESKLASSEFDESAMSGFEKHGLNTSSMKSLDKRWTGSTNTALWITLAVAAAVILIVWLIPRDMENQNLLLAKNDNAMQVTDTLGEDVGSIESTNSTAEQPEQVKSGESNRQPEVVPSAPSQGPKHSTSTGNAHPLELQEDNFAQPMQPLSLEKIKPKTEDQSVLYPDRINEKEVYLHDLKFIDYRGQRFISSTDTRTLSGTSAEREKKVKTVNEAFSSEKSTYRDESTQVAYHDFLTETAFLMKSGDYKKALSNFSTILKAYPNDDNALFYSGYCLFNLGKFADAIPFFKQSEQSVRVNFNEEAEWYLFLSYVELKEKEAARLVGKNIVMRNGFYKSQAAKILATLN